MVEVTEATRARDREVFGKLARRTGALVGTYPEGELAVIVGFLDRTRELTTAYVDELVSAVEPVVERSRTAR